MQFMFCYPERSGADADMLDAGPVADLAKAAEEAGFLGFAFTEHPAPPNKWIAGGGHQTLDPFVALGHAAAVTSRLRLLTYLSVLPYRNPSLLAKSAATVDVLSGGRFILGVGTGYLKAEFHALGVDFEERNALFDEALGRHFSCRDVIARPRPPRGTIPIWIGGNSALTRRRVAERAQGWMPMIGPAELFRTTRTPSLSDGADLGAAIVALNEAAGPRSGPLDVLLTYPDRSITDRGGDLARHRDAIAAYESAGVTWIAIAGETVTLRDSLEFIERFGGSCIDA
jgi:probable F420-dependent oxidoreductase